MAAGRGMAVCLLAAGVSLAARAEAPRAVRLQSKQLSEDLQHAPLRAEHMFVIWHPDLFGALLPFSDDSVFRDWHWVFLDGHQRDPRHQRLMAAWKWPDVSSGLREDPTARLISSNVLVPYLEKFFNEHYGPGWKFVPEWRGAQFTIYRVAHEPQQAPQ